MSTCPQCGNQNKADATFCRSCGEMLPGPAPATPPPPPAVPRQSPTPSGSPTPAPTPPQAQPQRPKRRVIRIPQRQRPVPQPPPAQPRRQAPGPYGSQPGPYGGQPGPVGGRSGPFGGGSGLPPIFGPPRRRGDPGLPPWGAPRQAPRRRGGCCGPMLLLLLVAFFAVPYLLGQLPDLLGGSVESGSDSTPVVTRSATPSSSWTWDTLTRTGGTATSTPGATATAGRTGTAPTTATTYPGITLVGHECPRVGTGPYAGIGAARNTSCTFAAATQAAYLASGANGRATTLSVYSSARGQRVALNCRGSQPVSCNSTDGAAVYLYGGEATFRS